MRAPWPEGRHYTQFANIRFKMSSLRSKGVSRFFYWGAICPGHTYICTYWSQRLRSEVGGRRGQAALLFPRVDTWRMCVEVAKLCGLKSRNHGSFVFSWWHTSLSLYQDKFHKLVIDIFSHMRLVLMLLRRRREILRFKITKYYEYC